ncbi:growth-regulating factor 5-like isoform X2 [Carex littledalei]|uniref:Growth-regulating factor n=1 Tax=Carex littledalei TaxID=544730 RepID=A0A833QT31_9POAL|nr:growth-regulating factor 5-like isoform X2 [Carex littledalei]
MSGGFTASQWVELEHQALIFKYLMAGVPVPPDLLLPIRRSFDPLQSPFYHHSSLGYYAYYGKKLDPEPWRCRRTDGKKWRCAKEAYPDSKYCERHMHRGRNRSRKPVESSSTSNSISTTKAPSPPATSSLLTSVLNPSAPRGFDPLSAPTAVSGNSGSQGLCLDGPTSTHGYLNRYSNTLKPESGEHHFFSEPSGTAAYGTVDFAMTSLSSCKSRDMHTLGGLSYSSYGDPMQEELGQVVTISSLPREQEKPPPHSFLEYGFRHEEPVKPENQLLRPFFDEWPKNRESWLEFESERSNRNSSFSTTRLSISIPMGSSASSPNDG